MNITIYFSALMLILIGMGGILLVTRYRLLQAAERARTAHSVDAARYEPMARLLLDRDLDLVAADKQLSQRLRAHRCRVFRGYTRCLTKDFGALLGGIRHTIVNSDRDRRDLIQLIARCERNFLLTLCRIEIRLFLYRYGFGSVNVSDLIAQVNAMGELAPALTAAA